MRECSNCKHYKETLPGLYQCNCAASTNYKEDVEPEDCCAMYSSHFARSAENIAPGNLNEISERIKASMGRNYTAKSLSEAAGLHESTVRAALSGKGSPNVRTLIEIARVLNVSMDWLCGLNEGV